MRLWLQDVLVVQSYIAKGLVAIRIFVTIAKRNGIQIKRVMQHVHKDHLMFDHHQLALVKIQDKVRKTTKISTSNKENDYLFFFLDDIKPCPRCQVLIVKMDDGSCNHMMCAVCGAEFCWLCMKEISDLHYLR